MLKNETIIETPEDVNGVLELCAVLIQEQPEMAAPGIAGIQDGVNGMGAVGGVGMYGGRPRAGVQSLDLEQLAEEQGWVARMVHLFRADDLEVQFEVGLL